MKLNIDYNLEFIVAKLSAFKNAIKTIIRHKHTITI